MSLHEFEAQTLNFVTRLIERTDARKALLGKRHCQRLEAPELRVKLGDLPRGNWTPYHLLVDLTFACATRRCLQRNRMIDLRQFCSRFDLCLHAALKRGIRPPLPLSENDPHPAYAREQWIVPHDASCSS